MSPSRMDPVVGKYYDDLNVGDTEMSGPRVVTEQDVMDFARLSGDHNPLHVDKEYAERNMFRRQIAHGMLTASIATGMVSSHGLFYGTVLAFMQADSRFLAPVYIGDALMAQMTVLDKKETAKPGRGVIIFQCLVRNQNGVEVCDSTWTIMMKKRK